jgi:hypothetical protein
MPNGESNDTASEEEKGGGDVWHVVSSKRSARGKTHLKNIQNAKTTFRFGEEDDQDEDENPASFESLVNETTRKLLRAKKDVHESSFFKRAMNVFKRDELVSERLKNVQKMIVLGTGSFRHSATSRYQMMFAILLVEEAELMSEVKKVCVYDPAFGKVDVEVLKRMKVEKEGVRVEAWSAEQSKAFVENREDDDDRNETVFAYMPHCEADLYEEILEHRWVNTGSETDPMRRILLCGNKFSNYHERWSFANNSRLTTKTKRKPKRVVVVGNAENECVEKEVSLEGETKESKFALNNGAFNDTAVHVFKSGFVRPSFLE